MVAYKLNSIVQLKSGMRSTNNVKLGYGNVSLKKESTLGTGTWKWEGMDFAIVRLKKQTVIPRRDKKESQCMHAASV